MTDEIAQEVSTLLHKIARVIGDIDKEKKCFKQKMDRNIKGLLVCREEVLKLVRLINKENGKK